MPVIKHNLVAKAWWKYCAARKPGQCFFADFGVLMGMTFLQTQLFSNFYQTAHPVQVSEATARKIKVMAEYPAEHHHTLLKAIDAIYSDDPPEENQWLNEKS